MSTFSEYIPDRFSSPLAAALAEASRGRRIVGYIGDDVPVELILAADALPVRIDASVGATPLADRYLESSFGPALRSYLQQWLSGALDFMDAVVFPRSNDSAQRLYYYVCELQRRGICAGPRALIFDLARVGRETSRQHTITATHRLASELGAATAKLADAVHRVRQRISFARRLAGLRTYSPSIAASDATQAWRALQLDWTERFEATVREWSVVAPQQRYAKNLVLAGSTPPDDRLHKAVEAANCLIVDEIFDGSSSQCVARWDGSGPTLESIADAYRAARTTAATLLDAPPLLLERVRAVGAQGVILWLIEQDEGFVWEVPKQLAHLHAAKIPVLALTRQAWDAGPAVLDRITQFAQELVAHELSATP